MKKQMVFILFALLLNPIVCRAQLHWAFDNALPLTSTDGSSHFNLQSIRELELTEGISGKGMRTDGYTTWLVMDINTEVSAISGWFALESFPTDTAAFYGIRNIHNETVAICVDRFGTVTTSIGNGETYTYIPTNGKVERFKWLHICMEETSEGLIFYLNGVKLEIKQLIQVSLATVTEVLIARDFREKKVGLHHVTAINGLIDEFRLHTRPLDAIYAKTAFDRFADKTPMLAIPVSRFAGDFSRPAYHLLPAANWTNETHGLFYHKEKYHIFNQKNASNLFLGQINWGHFSSPDLVNWTEHKPAITPEPGYDMNGIWSGHAVINDKGEPTLIYTAGGEKYGVGLAFPANDELTEWRKYEGNPVIYGQPEGYSRTDPRDQYVWKEGDLWYMIIGFGIAEEGIAKGAVLLYKSADLKKWNFVHTLFEGNPAIDNSGAFWEMPLFFKTSGKYVLMVNKTPQRGVPARALYWVGDFRNERFIPDNTIPRNLEVINRLLSPSLSYDKEGRLTTMAIIPDEIGSRAAYQHGWTHLYSIPRVWNLRNSRIEQTPHPGLEQLRGERQTIKATVKDNSPILISQGTHQQEIKVRFASAQSEQYGFILHKNPDNSEYSLIYYDVTTNEMVVDQRKSSLKKDIPLQIRKDTYPLDSGKPEDFHLFIDGSVVEVFINGKEAFTTRIFPLQANSNQVEVFSSGGSMQVEGEWWKLNPARMQADF
jgi:beta-fructofuranosidase